MTQLNKYINDVNMKKSSLSDFCKSGFTRKQITSIVFLFLVLLSCTSHTKADTQEMQGAKFFEQFLNCDLVVKQNVSLTRNMSVRERVDFCYSEKYKDLRAKKFVSKNFQEYSRSVKEDQIVLHILSRFENKRFKIRFSPKELQVLEFKNAKMKGPFERYQFDLGAWSSNPFLVEVPYSQERVVVQDLGGLQGDGFKSPAHEPGRFQGFFPILRFGFK